MDVAARGTAGGSRWHEGGQANLKAETPPQTRSGYRGVHAIIAELFPEVRSDVELVEAELGRLLAADNPLLTELATHLLRGGGKRLRPALVMISGLPFSYRRDSLVPVAAAVELIHMATLIHDDVVDRASLRRGVDTVNSRWGDRASVLLGDYLFAQGFSTLAVSGDSRVVRAMADVVFRMSAGEIEQMTGAFNTEGTVSSYLQQIDKKTAYFIGECCRVGALVSSAPEATAEALRYYGYGVGMGFQIVDDILDLTGEEAELGKRRGTDLRSGVYTLPVLYVLQHSSQGRELRQILHRPQPLDDAAVAEAINLIRAGGGIEHAAQVAQRYIDEAKASLALLSPGPARERLLAVADFVGDRRF